MDCTWIVLYQVQGLRNDKVTETDGLGVNGQPPCYRTNLFHLSHCCPLKTCRVITIFLILMQDMCVRLLMPVRDELD